MDTEEEAAKLPGDLARPYASPRRSGIPLPRGFHVETGHSGAAVVHLEDAEEVVLRACVSDAVKRPGDVWLGQRTIQLYCIEVTQGEQKWSVLRRYSDFYRLHEEISAGLLEEISRCLT